jgi:S-formylglutathione hydrolase FrmB
MYVYLPPSYGASERRYSVLYFLHGFDGDYGIGRQIAAAADRVFTAGAARDMIIVVPDGNNRLGGSFYTDSATTGNFERYITQEVVSFIDRKYRTLPTPASRALVGHSMGGNGALRLAMQHPDVYGTVFALSPCCMTWAGEFSLRSPAWTVTSAMQSMDGFDRAPFLSRVFMAISAAWSPGQRPPFFASLPVRSLDARLVSNDQVAAHWLAEMPVALADQYDENLRRLRGIGFGVGYQEDASIVTGAWLFSEALTRNGIEHEYQHYQGGHGDMAKRFATSVLPFLSQKMDFGITESKSDDSGQTSDRHGDAADGEED